MKWLVAVQTDTSLQEVGEHLRNLGDVEVDIEGAVPMSDDEIVIPVDGPVELPRLARGDGLILGVWEDSEVSLF